VVNHPFLFLQKAKSYINCLLDPLITMNKRMNFMFTIAAIAVMGGALFGSTFTAQLSATTFDVK
jgi:hypothetical protein